MDLDWRFIAIFFVLSFPTTVVLLTVDSIYLGNRSVHVSALNPWVLSLVDWLLLNKSFYFSRLSVVSSFSLTLSFCISLPLHAGRHYRWRHRFGLVQTPSSISSLWDPCSWCQPQAARESEVPGGVSVFPFSRCTARPRADPTAQGWHLQNIPWKCRAFRGRGDSGKRGIGESLS